MPDDDAATHGLWARTAPPAPATGPLAGAVEAEVAVIGAGYTGLAAALALAERKVEVVALEAAEVGFGGSGRNVGLVNAGMWVMPETLAATLGADRGGRLLDLLGAAPGRVFDLIARHGIDCEAERAGTLHLAVGRRGLAELAARERQWRARGAPVRLLDAAATAARLGAPGYAGALFDPRAGTIQPLAYARGLARAAIAAGARLHTRSPVGAIARAGADWRLATPAGAVTAKWVLVCTDAYTAGVFPGLRAGQTCLPYFNLATEPLAPARAAGVLPGREGAWDTRAVLTSWRMDRAGRLIIGSVGALRRGGGAVHAAWARRALARLWPDLAGVRFEAGWHGRIGMTEDHLPRFHRLDERILAVGGYNGRGIAPGTVLGGLLGAIVAGDAAEADMPLSLTSPVPWRGRRLREAWYEFGAQAAHLADALR